MPSSHILVPLLYIHVFVMTCARPRNLSKPLLPFEILRHLLVLSHDCKCEALCCNPLNLTGRYFTVDVSSQLSTSHHLFHNLSHPSWHVLSNRDVRLFYAARIERTFPM
ncbi:hypothetical protein GQ44DRAFT_701509 [Phaeosphaeriaceae sp. PMI808]|nr:hypothetical protein GQ44DRAFT_701509 [Phaeosphaeriaceae sp. PMI808]